MNLVNITISTLTYQKYNYAVSGRTTPYISINVLNKSDDNKKTVVVHIDIFGTVM